MPPPRRKTYVCDLLSSSSSSEDDDDTSRPAITHRQQPCQRPSSSVVAVGKQRKRPNFDDIFSSSSEEEEAMQSLNPHQQHCPRSFPSSSSSLVAVGQRGRPRHQDSQQQPQHRQHQKQPVTYKDEEDSKRPKRVPPSTIIRKETSKYGQCEAATKKQNHCSTYATDTADVSSTVSPSQQNWIDGFVSSCAKDPVEVAQLLAKGEHEVTVHFYCNCNCIEKYTVTVQLHYSCLKCLGCP